MFACRFVDDSNDNFKKRLLPLEGHRAMMDAIGFKAKGSLWEWAWHEDRRVVVFGAHDAISHVGGVCLCDERFGWWLSSLPICHTPCGEQRVGGWWCRATLNRPNPAIRVDYAHLLPDALRSACFEITVLCTLETR